MKMWITKKNKGGLVFLWLHKPFYKESCNMWFYYENGVADEDNLRFGLYLGRNIFPEVTFENSPMEVELVIKK